MFRPIRWPGTPDQPQVLYDRRGHARPEITLPGYRRGEHPPNFGLKLPAEILTCSEIGRLMAACDSRDPGARNRALIVVLWRSGLRSAEALALEPRDVDRDAGTVTVRHGKGNRRRTVGMDQHAFDELELWMRRRELLRVPAGATIFCTLWHGSLGRPLAAPYWREAIKKLARRAGIEKRVHSHGLRHTFAVELHREGVPLLIISRALGHSSIAVTERYLNHLEPREVVSAMRERPWRHDASA